MNCPIETRETSELLLGYCARTLDAGTAALIERHIAGCSACRELFAAQQAVWRALDEFEALPVTRDFDRRLYARIDRDARLPWWNRVRLPAPRLVQRGLPAAVAAGLILMAGLILERPGKLPAPPPEARAESVQVDQVESTLEDMELLRTFQRDLRAAQPSAM
ncbi:MAG: anti-sigma factor [Bryobacteraceae bacterium]